MSSAVGLVRRFKGELYQAVDGTGVAGRFKEQRGIDKESRRQS